MNDVFISYSRRDKVFVQKLYDCLTAANRTVWADWDSIPAASDWFAEIKQGIQETDSVVFVLSPEWIKSNECRKELNYAVEMGKRLFPILYIPVDPKDVPPELAKINWVYMRDTDDFDKAFQTLCSAMDTDLDWIKTHTRIQVRALEWEKKKRDHSFVLRGNDLTEGEQFISGATGKSPEPTRLQGEYILASRTDATRRQRQTLTGVTVALVVSIALGIVAFFQRQEAVRQARIALARQLVAQAQLVASKPQIAIPLVVQSMKLDESADASQLLEAISLPRQIAQKKQKGPVHSLAFSPDGKYVVSEGCDRYDQSRVCIQGSAHVWEAMTGKDISSMTYDGDVYAVAFSPNGMYVITEGCDQRNAGDECIQGSARVWEATTGQELSHRTHKGWVLSVAFSPDSKYAASGGADGIVHIWEVITGKEIKNITHQSAVNSVIFNPDGKSIVSADDSNAHMWEISTGTEIMQISTGGTLIILSKDGKYLAFGTETTPNRDPRGGGGGGGGEHPIHIWDVATKREIISDHQYGSITSLTFSRDGKYLWGNGSGDAYIWDTATGKEISRITHTGSDDQFGNIELVTLSPDEKYLLTSDYSDNTVRVWEIATGKEVTHMPHDISITALAFSPDEKYMASGGGDGSVYVWVPNGEQQISKIIDGYLYPSLSPNGQFLVADNGCIQYHNNICLYQYALRKVLALTQAQYVPIFTQFSPNDQYIVSKSCKSGQLCTQSTLYIWDVSSGKEVNHKDYHSDVTFDISPDGKYMISAVKETFDMTPVGELTVSAEGETTAHLWETSTGKEIVQMSHKDPIDFVAFSPNGKYVVGVGCDVKNNKSFCTQSSSIVWSVETGKEVAHFTHKGSVAPMFIGLAGDYSVSTTFSADGQHIVSEECDHRYEDGFCAQHTIIIWNATTGQAVSDWFDISSKVFFNPQKDYLAAIGADKALHILEISSGKEVTRISIASDVKDVAFSPDGKYIATEDSDNAGHVWDITTGKEVARITHNREVYGVAFSLDGKHIISQYGNATIIWEWHADDLIANACQHMPRNLTRAEWAQFIGDAMPYQAVCENLPIEPEVTDTPTVTP